ncbi:AAA family ATPase [Janthinobacterium sp. BJB446]|uniref:AAA family ATPase n=1 Tax=Janthinobacterium sp. BJB446 TaxID=2048009 RepID=UPI000C0D276B|nr:AAA family ATPase [Janthinobacterium sp. BJB446]PHV19149.1 AAA family ATPase [Janthinobacterium sp. BJB446]
MIDIIYEAVERQYFESGDFNGMPIYALKVFFDVDTPEFRSVLRKGIENEVLTANFHGNTHIKPFSKMPTAKVLEDFDSAEYPSHTCLYPHPSKLASSPRLSGYTQAPYELELAKGGGQLDFRTFDLSVLEHYRNDPRYSYSTDFIHGQICIEDAYYESGKMAEHDQILLETFGFAYDDDLNRYVAVFLRYISKLSPEHQRVWHAKEVSGNIKLHPDYYASSIEGSWGTRISIFEAFVMELQTINQMCALMKRPPLFRNSFKEDRPKEFGFLLRPTVAEFNDFILLLDKMMSDNINKDFFGNDVEIETDEARDDGKIIVKPKGTVQILEAWFAKLFRAADEGHMKAMIASFKKVRKLRQAPAHKVNADAFDQEIFLKQRDIVIEAYDAVRTIRQAFASHPAVKRSPPEIDEQLFNGEIWDI